MDPCCRILKKNTVDELMDVDHLIGDDDDYLYADESTILQSRLDKLDINIPTGVEASLPLFRNFTDRGLGEITRARFPSPRYIRPRVNCGLNAKIMLCKFRDICTRMHREPEHVLNFVNARIGEKCVSFDGQQRLFFRKKYVRVIGRALDQYTLEEEYERQKKKRLKLRYILRECWWGADDIAFLGENNIFEPRPRVAT